MSGRSPEPLGKVMSSWENANVGQRSTSTGPLDVSLVTIYAGLRMAKMEDVFRPAGNRTQQMQELAMLRRWQFDSRLDSASRERARALVWKFQPNGWDEV
jgi:hypothetical protein